MNLRDLAGDARRTAEVEEIERAFSRQSGNHRHRPHFWADLEVRRAVIALHDTTTLDGAVASLARSFPADRCPSRSAIGRFWLSLDQYWRTQ